MATTRRRFLLGTAAGALAVSPAAGAGPAKSVTVEDLDRILAAPVLKLDSLDRPVTVASMELLRNGRTYLLRTRSTDGAEAITVPHPARTADIYPFVLKSMLPVFVGKDARQVERLLWDVYRHADNYKMQGIALWVGVAAAEIGLLELMGRVANRPVADFFGGRCGGTCPSTSPAATAATRPSGRSNTSKGWSPGPGSRRSSSASAGG
ncbi:MAG: hypothetical protein U0746_20565 [Gemmataceae bacterium]